MSKKTIKNLIFVIAVAMVMLATVLNLGAITGFLGSVVKVLKPVVIAFCLAFILNIPMSFFDGKIKIKSKKGKEYPTLSHAISLVLTLVIAVGVIAVILLVIIPHVTRSAQTIVAAFPAFTERALAFIGELLERFNITSERISAILLGGENIFDKVGTLAQKYVSVFVRQAGSIGGSVISTVANAFLGIFLAVYFLAQKKLILTQIKRLCRAVLKPKLYKSLVKLAHLSDKSFENFISGQLIEAVILGCLCFVGMLIFRFPYAAVVSVLVGVTALVPIVGAWIGCGISALIILISDPIKAIGFIVFFLILQQLENNLIYPRVVGQRVGLPGVWVLLAVVIGNGMLGALGALIAVPVASIFYVLLGELVRRNERSLDVSQNSK